MKREAYHSILASGSIIATGNSLHITYVKVRFICLLIRSGGKFGTM